MVDNYEADIYDEDVMGMDEDDDGEDDVMNLDDVDENAPDEFPSIPVGIYDAIIENVEYGDSKKGNKMLTWTFKLVHPEFGDRMFFFYTVVEKGMSDFQRKTLKKTLVRVCPDLPLKKFSPKTFATTGEAIGLPCRLKIDIQKKGEYKGRNQVKEVLRATNDTGYLDD